MQRSSASIELHDSGKLERAISTQLLGIKSLAARSCFSLFSRALLYLLADLALTGLYTSPLLQMAAYFCGGCFWGALPVLGSGAQRAALGSALSLILEQLQRRSRDPKGLCLMVWACSWGQ